LPQTSFLAHLWPFSHDPAKKNEGQTERDLSVSGETLAYDSL
jgi:hypothetical protein